MSEAGSEIVVMKFGGTSVAGAEQIKRAAGRIVAAREAGNRVVAVLSARGKTTDELVSQAHEISDRPVAREMDMLLSTGERISCALCAMAIHDMGHEAISLTGSQAGIVTDSSHTKARIIDVRADRISDALGEDRIVLVAGFQGVSTDSRDVTTLGRGGSDTTAVALAAALRASVCEIYTDVAGVYSADPRIVADARKLPAVSFEEMLEMAASGGPRAAAALGRVRAQPRRSHPLPQQLRGRSRYPRRLRGRDDGAALRNRSHPFRRRGARDADRAARRARGRRPRLQAPSPTPTSTST
jgi:aspartokinase